VFQDILQGAFQYRGSQAFLLNGNTQARVAGGQVLVDSDGASDITITPASPMRTSLSPVISSSSEKITP
jgi:hypothetical protein